MNKFNSVIAAVSTPPGKGGVAIIRVSGSGAAALCDKVFIARGKKRLTEATPRVQYRGDIIHEGQQIDDGMATVFLGPNSYTGEDTVEISCHGGVLVTSLVLEALFAAGARAAEPGEFTKRAYINGKISLTDAEAIGDLIDAKSYEQIRLSNVKSREKLNGESEKIREELMAIMSSVYARIDYPDEDLGELSGEQILRMLEGVRMRVQRLLSTYKTGRAINEGVKTVICGKTNAGKSSIYNSILGFDAAIVTDIKGTTRDVLSDTVNLGKILLRISDTAGIRSKECSDRVERIGISRSLERIDDSELIFAVFDLSRELDGDDRELLDKLRSVTAPKILILNKTDLPQRLDVLELPDIFSQVVYTSAKEISKDLKDNLCAAVEKLFTDEKLVIGEDAVISSARQNGALIRALDFINLATEALKLGLPEDAVCSDVERALGAVSELDGKEVSEAVVSEIFKNFCVGK